MTSMELTREQRILGHKRFLAVCGQRVAAFAWDGFQKSGRGMVAVPEDDCLRDELDAIPPRLTYAAKGSPLLTEISLHFEKKEWGWLETYDPEKLAIVIVIRTDVGTSGYLIGGLPRRAEVHTW